MTTTTTAAAAAGAKSGDGSNGVGGQQQQHEGTSKRSILALPLVAPRNRLTASLLADPLTPHPAALLSVPASSPSLLRRSRGVGEGAHFTYVSPLTLEFPYDLKPDAEQQKEEEEREKQLDSEEGKAEEEMTAEERQERAMKRAREGMERVERLMRPLEIHPDDVQSKSTDNENDGLQGFLPKGRKTQTYPSARLLALSTACIDDCLPALDTGDASAWIKAHNGQDGPSCYSSGPMAKAPETAAERARYELSDYLSGRLIGARLPAPANLAHVDEGAELGVAEAKHQRIVRLGQDHQEPAVERYDRRMAELSKRAEEDGVWQGYAPWANAYSGHQFGVWAGQLGDGRAVSLMEALDTTTGHRWEVQLKGAGRTPYSRFADGLATLGSSVREFLASEHLAALGIPTSRALAVTSLPDLPVVRERRNAAAVCTRLAPIWTRIGSFEHHAERKEWESARLLAEFVARQGYGWPLSSSSEEGKASFVGNLVLECARRNAAMIAKWQALGFMHGVMNTDNISLLGITIDFGPYAMMDLFDQSQICNKSDGEGRYTYKMQPTMGLYALEKLLDAVAPLVGYEREHGHAPAPGVLVRATGEQIAAWGAKGQELREELKTTYMATTLEAWKHAWLHRLGLDALPSSEQQQQRDDREELIDPLLAVLEECDFSTTLRRLCAFAAEPTGQDAGTFAEQWISWDKVPEYLRETKREGAARFLATYAARLQALGDNRLSLDELRQRNPAFVLRNWVTDEVVQRLETKDDTDFLERVLAYCVDPFKEPSNDEEKRLCSIGTPLTGNMPSCSS